MLGYQTSGTAEPCGHDGLNDTTPPIIMIQRILFLSATALCLSLALIPCILKGQTPTPTVSLEQRVSDLEKRVKELESLPMVARKNPPTAAPSPSAVARPDQPLELKSWEYKFKPNKEWHTMNRHVVTYVLNNTSAKPIKLVEGSITFTDLLGEKILVIGLTKDVEYDPGVPVSTTGEWATDWSGSSEMRMTTLAHDDIKASLTIDRVVFADNTVWSAGQAAK